MMEPQLNRALSNASQNRSFGIYLEGGNFIFQGEILVKRVYVGN